MRPTAFHHVGLIVESIDAALPLWEAFGYRVDIRVSDPIQKADIALLARDGEPYIELVAPLGPDSPSHGWLKRIKAGAYHTCFLVADMTFALNELAAAGFVSVMAPVPAVAFGGRLVSFVWSKSTGLLELLQATTT